MAIRQRTITGTVTDGDTAPIVNGQVRFKPTKPLAYTTTHIVVDSAFTVQTNDDGYFEIDIWCDEDSLVQVDYNVYFPNANGGQAKDDHSASFSLQYGDGSPISLSLLINASVPAPTPQELLYTMILELIAASGGGPPSGGAGGVLSGNYPNPGFANDMVEQSELTAALSSRATLNGAETLTNKRINPRVGSIASNAAPTPNANAHDVYELTALATNAVFAAPSGTPVDGQSLLIRIKDDGTARTLAFNSIYRPIGVTLPATTTIGKTIYLGIIYNAAASKFDVLGVAVEA